MKKSRDRIWPEYRLANTEENSTECMFNDLGKSLEKLLSKRARKNQKDPLERLVSDKIRTLKAGVTALLDEIELRKNLDTHLVNTINEEICAKHTEIMQLDKVKPQYNFDLFKEMNSDKMQLEEMVLGLEKEKRKEYLECWKDMMFLKRYLLFALKEYWDLVKRREVLESEE